MRATLISTIMALLVVCSAAWANDPEYSVTEDVSFGELPRQTLDIYTPESVTDETPVLMYLFGGGFFRGDKTQAQTIGPKFAEAGIIVVAPNYRVNTNFPNFIEDGAKAVGYVWRELRTSTDQPRQITTDTRFGFESSRLKLGFELLNHRNSFSGNNRHTRQTRRYRVSFNQNAFFLNSLEPISPDLPRLFIQQLDSFIV